MNDGMLLQINRQRNLIPEDRLKAAQSIQEKERADGKPPRPLLDILATRGDLPSTTVRLIRNLMQKGIDDAVPAPDHNGSDATVVEGFHAVVESVLMPAPDSLPKGANKSGWPKEVLDAEQDLKNLFGQFVLVAQVGSGGSGTVYRAWDRRVSRYSGVKILHTMEPSALERFTREARIAGNLQHPSIATIYEVGEQDGRYYIAMKYIDGRPIDADPRSIPECLALIRDACRALDYAHKQGIIHRDVKPANLLVDSQDRVYVTDFGIAKQSAHDQTSTLSITGTIIGTPKYLPPEQARGEAKRADARSDVYSIGATLYTLLAGRAPFPSSNVWETLESVMKHEPPPLTSLNGAVSPELERIVAKAMSKEPSRRFPSAGELADELDRLIVQRRYTGRYGLLRYLARKWVWLAAAGVIVGVALHLSIRMHPEAIFPVAGPAHNASIAKPDTTYDLAATQFLKFLDAYETIDPQNRKNHLKRFVVDPVQQLSGLEFFNLHAQVLIARAEYGYGDWSAAEERLNRLRGHNDYRIKYLRGLKLLEDMLNREAPPLPDPDGPPDLILPAVDPPVGFDKQLFAINDVPVELLHREHSEDKKAAAILSHFVNARWREAATGQTSYTLPVIQRAQHRATYLSKDWSATLKQGEVYKGKWHDKAKCRECRGSQMALAFRPERPISDLVNVRKLWADDSSMELLILACMARRSVERGIDPESVLAAAEKLPAGGKSELRGVLRVAGLRWKALSGADDEADYAKALAEIGENPATWMGKRARIEALISKGSRLRMRRGDFAPPLNEAIGLANRLGDGGWIVPRVLRGEASLRMGIPGDTFKELPTIPESSKSGASDITVNLVSAAAHLRMGNFTRAAEFANLANEGFRQANEGLPDHPVAMYLWGAATLEDAKTKEDPSDLAALAVDRLTLALVRIPGYVEARYDRACANFLIADFAAHSKSQAKIYRLYAYDDIQVVLKQVEGLPPAVELQKYLRKFLEKDGVLMGATK